MLIKAENLSKVYGGGENKVTALYRANMEIAAGDFISIMGPSGSGKSTLLHLLSGLDFPTEGRLSYDNQDIYQLNDRNCRHSAAGESDLFSSSLTCCPF